MKGMGGLGDCIYQRPLVRHLSQAHGVWLSTPYPEVYSDLPVQPVLWPAGSKLRCQQKNVARAPRSTWTVPPVGTDRVRIAYPARGRSGLPGSIVEHMEEMAGANIRHFQFDLPDFGRPEIDPPYAVIRPVSVRSEWPNPARNPRPEYVSEAARELRRQGYTVVCVGDIAPPSERLIGEMPEADRYWTKGELATAQMLALVQHASLVVGAVGWIVPASVALRTPAVIIGGGHGTYNSPEVLIDQRMDDSRIRFLLPSPYCRCISHTHECTKVIPDFLPNLRQAMREVSA